ncbi:MAG: hypothetical protein V4651_06980, partial [Bacteroidota bacterium]
FNFAQIKESEGFLYINYFGLKDSYIHKLQSLTHNLIIDNVQSFFSTPIPRVNTFYSTRKFFGVPDGAYLYSNSIINDSFEIATSSDRMEHLLTRVDQSAEAGYAFYQKNEDRLKDLPVQFMSNLTRHLLTSIEYQVVADIRKRNFQYLHSRISAINKLSIQWDGNQVPMNYPLWSDIHHLRDLLLAHKVYCPVYWPGVLKHKREHSLEENLVTDLVCIPIDQRYTIEDMNYIINLILTI